MYFLLLINQPATTTTKIQKELNYLISKLENCLFVFLLEGKQKLVHNIPPPPHKGWPASFPSYAAQTAKIAFVCILKNTT
jgi:hypothetical protein